jgi:uncharacterized protein
VAAEYILWRRVDQSGHEFARVFSQDSQWHLTGTAVFAHEGRPCQLDYVVVCNSRWESQLGRITGWLGGEAVRVDLIVGADRRWTLNGTECPDVAGCIDLDLNFSPSTNLLPIRRLNLAVGQRAEVRAAWLRFPSFTLEPLEQVYHRVGPATYRYESAGGRFVAELQVNDSGLVTRYADFWQAE